MEGMMKAYTEYITFSTKNKREFIRITDKVQEIVNESGIKKRSLFCFSNAFNCIGIYSR